MTNDEKIMSMLEALTAGMDAKFAAVNQRLEHIEEVLEDHTDRLQNIDLVQTEHTGRFQFMDKKIGSFAQSLWFEDNKVIALNNRVEKLEAASGGAD